MLGDVSPGSIVLILRETRSTHNARYGQQSLGLRSITFNVGSLGELDRIESLLRTRSGFAIDFGRQASLRDSSLLHPRLRRTSKIRAEPRRVARRWTDRVASVLRAWCELLESVT